MSEPAAHILIVDDEPEALSILEEVLEGDGHRVHKAHNGLAALTIFHQRSFDLVVSDMRMPELNGVELYETLRAVWPDASRRFVLVTGDPGRDEVRAFAARTGVPVLGKPLGIMETRRVIRQLLGD